MIAETERARWDCLLVKVERGGRMELWGKKD